MNKLDEVYSNPCMRCGRERIVLKIWEEKTDAGSPVTITKTACPDSECQKKVDSDNQRQRDKNALMKLRSQQRVLQRRAERETKKTSHYSL